MALDPSLTQYDINGDGKLTDDEIKLAEERIDLSVKRDQFIENAKKADQQRQMAWIGIITMIVFTALLFSPFISVQRVIALQNLIGMFYISMAGIIAAFFGVNAYMTVNQSSYGGYSGYNGYGGYGNGGNILPPVTPMKATETKNHS